MNLVDLIFPKNCLGCKINGSYLCPSCISKISKPKPVCPECEKRSIDGFTHVRCQKKYGINGLVTIWDYEGVIRRAVLALKYKYATEVINELTGSALQVIKDNEILMPKNCFMAPIPLHWYKENCRGFNQSGEMGKRIAAGMGWKFIPDLLIKKRFSAAQVDLKGTERVKNIRGVFAFNPKYFSLLPRTLFILFDDVYTTGSTLKEAAMVLKRSGVEKVWGLTIAR